MDIVHQHWSSHFNSPKTVSVLAVIVDDSITEYNKIFFLDEEGNGQSESEERLPDLPLLSEQLLLDELWDMLGECLKELEESHDQHAVLGKWNPT